MTLVTLLQCGVVCAADDAPAELQEVTVTGSRIAQRDFAANSPITTVGLEDLDAAGAITLEAALATLPQFTVGSGPTTTGFFASGQATLNLRGLGSARNLVLIDGRRVQPSNSQQVVDINTIPKALIEGVEVITGGASAVYGSDAIAGVVNFRTRREFEGVQFDVETNPTQRYGGTPQSVSLTVGGNLAEGRGNALLSVSYAERGTIDFLDVPFYRQWAGAGDFRTWQGVYNPAANRPSQAALTSVFSAYGVAAPPPNTFISFNPDGTLFAASNGLANFKGGLGLVANGANVGYTNIASTVQTPLQRYTAFARARYDIAPSVEAFVQGQFVDYDSRTIAEAGNRALTIPVTNPFIPAALRTLLASRVNPTAPFSLEKRFYEAGPRVFERNFRTLQLLGGVKGAIEALDGSWEVYASHGRTDVTQRSPGSVVAAAQNALLNAADGGASLCADGYNPFGLSTLSGACLAYLTRVPLQTTEITQDVAEATLQGRLATLPAGDLRFAAGVAHIAHGFEYLPDGDIRQGTIVGVPQSGESRGTTRVNEAYAELRVPLLADRPFVHALSADLAYRRSDYQLSGGVDTYKADLSWAFVPALRLRGGYQRAVRAPNVGELFSAPTAGFANIGEITRGGGDPCAANSAARASAAAAQVRALCVAQGVPAGLIAGFTNAQNEIPSTNVGNTLLQPEKADTYTAGLVLESPSDGPWLKGLRASIDYYDISIDGVVGVIAGLQALNKCYNLDGSNPTYTTDNFYCSLLERDTTTGSLVSVLQRTVNLGAFETRGVDLQVDWRLGLEDVGIESARGSVTLNTLVSRLGSFEVQAVPGGDFADFTNTVGASTNGAIGSLPRWKATTSLGYEAERWGAGVRWRYIGSMRALARVSNPASTTPDTPSSGIVDVFGSAQLPGDVSLSFGVNNVLDRDPPVINGVAGTTEASTFDVLGRTYFVAARVRL